MSPHVTGLLHVRAEPNQRCAVLASCPGMVGDLWPPVQVSWPGPQQEGLAAQDFEKALRLHPSTSGGHQPG